MALSDHTNDSNDPRSLERAPGEGQTTTTVEEPAVETLPADKTSVLTPEEEKVIRMLHGKGLKGHEVLEFAPGASMETKLRLALIEANLLEAFDAEPLEIDPDNGSPRSVIADELER